MAEYRRFIAKTLNEAKKKMLQEMGDNAYIVKISKISKKSLLGLKNEDFVEIQAGRLDKDAKTYRATDFSKETLQGPRINVGDNQVKQKSFEASSFVEDDTKESKIKILAEVISTKNKELAGNSEILSHKNAYAVEKELDRRLYEIQEEVKKKVDTEKDAQTKKISGFLLEKDFSKDFSDYVAETYNQVFNETSSSKADLAGHVASLFRYAKKPKLYESAPNMVILIGLTGVGKTTTLAKIAAETAFGMRKKTLLATFDIKRIMATVQLERYAQMMEVPFRVIADKSALKKMIKDSIDYSYVLFDTSGTTKKDKDYFEEMKEFFDYITLPKEIHLCMNASSRMKEMEEIIHYFRALCYDRVIITKCDESLSLGPVLSVLHKHSLLVSFLTDGQDVPSDIHVANAEILKKKLEEEWA